ncbi:multidrug effflux MFS transporter [Jatrophihabitans sp. YIM 134969]
MSSSTAPPVLDLPEHPSPAVVVPPVVDVSAKRARLRLIVILGALTALGPLTVDTYLPALPAITEDLHTTDGAVGLTLTATLIGFALGQLLVGPLSDSIGRRRPILAGAALHVVASVACALAPNIATLTAFRVVEGMAASGAAVVAMAIVRDVAQGRAFLVMMSRLLLVMGAAPVLAPTLGSQVLRFTEWRGVFVMLAVIGSVVLVVTAFLLPESLPAAARRRGGIGASTRAYGALFRDRSFVGLALVAGLSMSAVFGYVSGSSFVMQQTYGLSVQEFGLAFGAGSVALIVGTQLNPRLTARWSSAGVLGVALVLALLGGVGVIVAATTGVAGLVGLLIPLWVVLFGVGVVLPNAPALALNGKGESAGTAAALLGAAQFGVAGLVGPVFGAVGVTATTMGLVITGGLALTLAVYIGVVRPWRLAPLSPGAAVVAAH